MLSCGSIANLVYLRLLVRWLDSSDLSIGPSGTIALVANPPMLNTALGISVTASLAIVLVLIFGQLATATYRYYFPPPKTSFGFSH